MKFTIDRNTWYRGEGVATIIERPRYDNITVVVSSGGSRLRLDSGEMCCLGFKAVADGIKPIDLIGHATPSAILAYHAMNTPLIDEYSRNSDITCALMHVNDTPMIEREGLREQIVKELFASIGDEVEFIN